MPSKRLEPCGSKDPRTLLRGPGAGNRVRLPSQLLVLLAIAAITLLLTMGGVSLFVVIFAVLPIARLLFKELDIPWHMFVATFIFGIG